MSEEKSTKDNSRRRRFGPDALPDGALSSLHPLPAPAPVGQLPPDRLTELVLAEPERGSFVRFLTRAKTLPLLLALIVLAFAFNYDRIGVDLSGGHLFPALDLRETWSSYFSSWHSVSGGTTAPVPASLAVLGIVGLPFAPLGGPAPVIALLILGDIPLAAVALHCATRRFVIALPVRWLLLVGYALLPTATGAIAYGRLDVVAAHILLPPVVIAIATALRDTAASHGGMSWVGRGTLVALALALAGAFSPFAYLTVLVGALVGFVVIPPKKPELKRRALTLVMWVFVSLGLLMPWPLAFFRYPNELLFPELTKFTVVGTPLIIVGCVLVVLIFVTLSRISSFPRLWLIGSAALFLAAFGSAILNRQGPLEVHGQMTLASTVANELTSTNRSIVILGKDGSAPRQTTGRLPAFGDDDTVPDPEAKAALDSLNQDLLSINPTAAIARAAARGILFIVMPDNETAARFRSEAKDLVADTVPTSDGRPVFRIQLTGGQAVLLSADQAQRAVNGEAPPSQLNAQGVVPVPAILPSVDVRVSAGAQGRLLVLAAHDDAGWEATVAGHQVPVLRAWGDLASVAIPGAAVDVHVEQKSQPRVLFLLVQAAFALFTLITAIPGRVRSKSSG